MTAVSPSVTWVARRPGAGRVWRRTIAIGSLGGAAFGFVVWELIEVATLASWREALAGIVFALPIGAIVGLALGIVAGGVIATFHARRPRGLTGAEARGVAGLAAGVPVLLTFGVPGVTAPLYVLVFVLPLTVATTLVAGWVAPRLVAPVWTARVQLNAVGVSARPSGAGAAAGRACPGSSRGRGR